MYHFFKSYAFVGRITHRAFLLLKSRWYFQTRFFAELLKEKELELVRSDLIGVGCCVLLPMSLDLDDTSVVGFHVVLVTKESMTEIKLTKLDLK